jgi:hypothetical protein
LSAIHYLAELSGSKSEFSTMHQSKSFPAHGNVWSTTEMVGFYERVTRCLLERLQDSLRRRDLWLENSDRWGDPRQKLLQGAEWQAQRIPVCRALGHPSDGTKAAEQLATRLDDTWKSVASRFACNAAVSISNEGKHPSLTISSLDKLDEPPALIQLNRRVRE